MQHQRDSLANRTRSIWAGTLTGRDVFGFVKTLAFASADFRASEDYAFIVLNTDADSRAYGLLPEDAVYVTPYWTAYGVPSHERLTTAQIAAQGPTRLDLPANDWLRLGVRDGALAIGTDVKPPPTSLLIGLLAPQQASVAIRSAELDHRLDLDPGLTWLAIGASIDAPVDLRADPAFAKVQIVAARLLPQPVAAELSLAHVPHLAVAVDVQHTDGVISGSIVGVNPSDLGGDIGLTFQETGTRGFWLADVVVNALANEIDFTYDPATRVLEQHVDGGVPSVREARTTDADDWRLFRLEFERGFVDLYTIPVLRYVMGSEGIEQIAVLPQVHVFDVIRPD